jgi:hypothetical protein
MKKKEKTASSTPEITTVGQESEKSSVDDHTPSTFPD